LGKKKHRRDHKLGGKRWGRARCSKIKGILWHGREVGVAGASEARQRGSSRSAATAERRIGADMKRHSSGGKSLAGKREGTQRVRLEGGRGTTQKETNMEETLHVKSR